MRCITEKNISVSKVHCYTVLALPRHVGFCEPFNAMGKDCSAGVTNVGKGTTPMLTGPTVPTEDGTLGHWAEKPEFSIVPPKGPVGR